MRLLGKKIKQIRCRYTTKGVSNFLSSVTEKDHSSTNHSDLIECNEITPSYSNLEGNYSNFEYSYTYDPTKSSSDSSRQYLYEDGKSSLNNQMSNVKSDKSKRDKEIEQYRKYRMRKREEDLENIKQNGKRVRGVGSVILPRKLKEEMSKKRRVQGGKDEISPIV